MEEAAGMVGPVVAQGKEALEVSFQREKEPGVVVGVGAVDTLIPQHQVRSSSFRLCFKIEWADGAGDIESKSHHLQKKKWGLLRLLFVVHTTHCFVFIVLGHDFNSHLNGEFRSTKSQNYNALTHPNEECTTWITKCYTLPSTNDCFIMNMTTDDDAGY